MSICKHGKMLIFMEEGKNIWATKSDFFSCIFWFTDEYILVDCSFYTECIPKEVPIQVKSLHL